MVLKAEQERVTTLLKDTITLLCRNGLSFNAEFSIEALIGITLDKDDVFLISIKELIQTSKQQILPRDERQNSVLSDGSESSVSGDSGGQSSGRNRRKRRKRSQMKKEGDEAGFSGNTDNDSDGDSLLVEPSPKKPNITTSGMKQELCSEEQSEEEVVFIKEELEERNWSGKVDDDPGPSDFPDDQMGELTGNNLVPIGSLESSDIWNQTMMSAAANTSAFPGGGTQTFPGGSTPTFPGGRTCDESGRSSEPGQENYQWAAASSWTGSHHAYTNNSGHSALKRYVCDVCNKAFMRRDHLEGHKAKHTGIKPFQCPFCSSSFGLKWNLKIHVEAKHKEEYNRLELNNSINFTKLLNK